MLELKKYERNTDWDGLLAAWDKNKGEGSYYGVPRKWYEDGKELSICVSDIFMRVRRMSREFYQIGLRLKDIRDGQLYRIEYNSCGNYYDNVYSFANQKLGLKSTTVKTMVGIVERFGDGDKLNNKLKIQFENYSFSQLVEMLPMADEHLALVSTDMTVAKIRELKKSLDFGQTSDQKIQPVAEDGFYTVADLEMLQFDVFIEFFRKALKDYPNFWDKAVKLLAKQKLPHDFTPGSDEELEETEELQQAKPGLELSEYASTG